MVLESVVADLLNRFLGDYVENLNKSQLKLGIWGGKREGAAGGLPVLAQGPTPRAPRPALTRALLPSQPETPPPGRALGRTPSPGGRCGAPGGPVTTSTAPRSRGPAGGGDVRQGRARAA